jgi:hypothetical protein
VPQNKTKHAREAGIRRRLLLYMLKNANCIMQYSTILLVAEERAKRAPRSTQVVKKERNFCFPGGAGVGVGLEGWM